MRREQERPRPALSVTRQSTEADRIAVVLADCQLAEVGRTSAPKERREQQEVAFTSAVLTIPEESAAVENRLRACDKMSIDPNRDATSRRRW